MAEGVSYKYFVLNGNKKGKTFAIVFHQVLPGGTFEVYLPHKRICEAYGLSRNRGTGYKNVASDDLVAFLGTPQKYFFCHNLFFFCHNTVKEKFLDKPTSKMIRVDTLPDFRSMFALYGGVIDDVMNKIIGLAKEKGIKMTVKDTKYAVNNNILPAKRGKVAKAVAKPVAKAVAKPVAKLVAKPVAKAVIDDNSGFSSSSSPEPEELEEPEDEEVNFLHRRRRLPLESDESHLLHPPRKRPSRSRSNSPPPVKRKKRKEEDVEYLINQRLANFPAEIRTAYVDAKAPQWKAEYIQENALPWKVSYLELNKDVWKEELMNLFMQSVSKI